MGPPGTRAWARERAAAGVGRWRLRVRLIFLPWDEAVRRTSPSDEARTWISRDSASISGRSRSRSIWLSRGHRLQPDRLPDAAGGGVVDGLRGENLLSLLLPVLVGRIPHGDHQLVFTCLEGIGDVETERDIAPGMLSDFFSVHGADALPVDRLEMEQDPFARPGLGDRETIGDTRASDPAAAAA